jgi:uncharacterized protein
MPKYPWLLVPLAATLLLLSGCACGGGDDFCPDGTDAKGGEPPKASEKWCEKDGKKQGPSKRWHSGGNPAEEGSYKAGKKFGKWTTWYEDGKPKIMAEWLDGLKEGPYLRYHRNGKKAEEGTYAEGEMDGVWTSYYDNGNKKESGEVTAGKRQGKWTNFDKSGKKTGSSRYKDGIEKKRTDAKAVVVENIVPVKIGKPDERCAGGGEIFGSEPPVGFKLWCEKDGVKNGIWRSWWENNNRWIEGQYAAGKKAGTWIEWYDNGHVTSKGDYLAGRKEGQWTEHYANGNRRTAGSYSKGRKIGAWKNWHSDGRAKNDEVFDGNKLLPDLE